jgi:DNA-binding NarL/FixJ family response regulator
MRPENRGATGSSALYGRAQSLTTLCTAFVDGRSCLVRGEAGVGKTTLIRAAAAESGRVVLTGGGIQVLRDVSYVPLRQALPSLPAVGEPAEMVAFIRERHPDVFLVIDDLHWCDADTIAVLEELCMSLPLVASVRDESPELALLVARITEVGFVLELGPLDDDSARRMIRDRSPGALDSDVERWATAAAGNPLMLDVALSTGVDATGERPGATVFNAIRTRPPTAVDALARLALAGAPAVIDDAARADLVAHRLVEVLSDGRCVPRHDLVAEAALQLVGNERRRALHSELADTADDASERARHLSGAGRSAEIVDAALAAAAEAATVWSRARFLLLAATNSPLGENLGLRVDAAEQLSLAGQYQDVIAVLDGVDLHDEEELAIRAGLALARAYWTETDMDRARETVNATLELVTGRGDVFESDLLSLQSRIAARADWDLETAIALGRKSVATAQACGAGLVAAHSALGLALLMANDPEWPEHLEAAGELAREEHDLHNAVVTFDSLLFGHLLAGDSSRCRALAAEMVRETEAASPAWNGYFRAAELMAALHVDGDYRAALEQGRRLLERRLTTRTREMITTVLAIARADTGDVAAAEDLARTGLADASDDAARSTACWALAEALWLEGSKEAIAVGDLALGLAVGNYPGRVSAVLIGQWARVDHGLPVDPHAVEALQSVLPNLQGATHEMHGLAAEDPLVAVEAFEAAAAAWEGRSRRGRARALWAAGEAAARAEQPERAFAHLHAADLECRALGLVPLGRRVGRALRALGPPAKETRRTRTLSDAQQQVLARVARGQTTQHIARSLSLEPSTVESHIRAAMRTTRASTRLQAAAVVLGAAPEAGVVRVASTVTRDADALAQSVAGHRRNGDNIVGFDALPPEPWTLAGEGVVATGSVVDADDVAWAVLAAVRGARVVVRLPDDLRLTADLVDGLQRVGEVTMLGPRSDGPRPALDPLAVRVFDLLAQGHTIGDIARDVGYSRRTVERRMIEARRQLGVATNVEALLVLRRSA